MATYEPPDTPSWQTASSAAAQRRQEALRERLRASRERADAAGEPGERTPLSILDLRVDLSYQGALDMGRVTELALNWRPDLAGELVVNQRPVGTLYVIDGQHRKAAWAMLHEGPELATATLPCLVLHLAGAEEEAELYHLLNSKRVAKTYEQQFRARLRYREAYASRIVECVTGVGLTPVYLRSTASRRTEPGQLAALKTCETIMTQTDPETLSTVLGLLVEAWGHKPVAVHRTLISGVYDFHIRYVDEYQRGTFIRLLRNIGPEAILEANPVPHTPRARALSVSLFIHERYNFKRTKGRLSPFGIDGEKGIQRVIRLYKEKRRAERREEGA
jgi:hypothetical protein